MNRISALALALVAGGGDSFAQPVSESKESVPTLSSFKTWYKRSSGYTNDMSFESKGGSQGKLVYEADRCFVAQDVTVTVEGRQFVIVVEKMTPRNPVDLASCEGIHTTVKISIPSSPTSSQNGVIFFKGNFPGSNTFFIRR